MYLFSICLFQHSKTKVYVLLAFLPGGQRLYIVVNGPSTNRKLIWQELTDVVEIREAWSILKVINPANRNKISVVWGMRTLAYGKQEKQSLFEKSLPAEGHVTFWKQCTQKSS